ncbi:MAG TPA: hypothetical protein VN456_17505, partial [Desulfosporosinus sp.]|nr:hypothetical protein [Desulfosporosinus sp.]
VMHDSLNFPLKCIYQQASLQCLKWGSDCLVGISLGPKPHKPFENPGIMQSFLRQVKKTKPEPQKERVAFTNWATKYGFLAPEGPFPSLSTLEDAKGLVAAMYPNSDLDPSLVLPINTTVNLFKENIYNFWTEARKLVLLWDMFEAFSNRNNETLKEFIVIENTKTKSDSPLSENAIIFQGKVKNFSFTMNFSASTEEIANNPFPAYQLIGFECVKSEVEKYLTDLTIASNLKNLNPIASRDHDLYELDYYIQPKNLLQAFYLQFYILLNGIRNKICPNCWKPFSPSKREDQIYCTPECKNNAKKKRQRHEHPELMFKELLYEDKKHKRLCATDRKKIEDALKDKGLRDAKALRDKLMKQRKTET